MEAEERARQEQLVVRFLDAGLSVNISGVRGSGRSTMLAGVTRELESRGRRILRVRGIRALSDAPFAALALSGIEVPSGRSAASTAAELMEAVADRLSAPDTPLVLDDADDLDRPSIGVLVAAAMKTNALMLTGTRPGGLRQSELDSFSAQLRPGVRVRLGPLGHAAVHAMVLAMLGGPVDAETHTAIALQSGGLPGLVSAIVRSGLVAERIVQRDGLWSLTGEVWDPLLGQVLEPLLVDLDPDVVDGLETLAWAGVVTIDAAVAMTSAATLSALDDAGITQMLDLGGESFVAVYPPLLAEHLRRDAPPVHRALAAARPDAASGRQGGSSRRGHGEERLLGQRMREHWQSELVARRAAWERAPSPVTANLVLEALHQLGDESAEALEVFQRTPGDTGSPRDRALLLTTEALRLATVVDDLDGAMALLSSGSAAIPTEAGYLRAIGAHLGFLFGRMPDEEELQPGPLDSDESVGALAAVRLEVLLGQGRTQDARRLADQSTVKDPWFRVNFELSQGLLLLFESRSGDAVAYARAHLEAARERLDGTSIEAHAYVISLSLMYGGRVEALGTHLESVLSITKFPSLQRHLRQGSLSIASLDVLWRGSSDHARSFAEQSYVLGSQPGPFPAMEPPKGVWAILAEGDEPTRDVEEIWSYVTERMSAGYGVYAITVGVWAMEHWPRPERLETVAAWAHASQSPMLRALGSYTQAIAADDARTMREAAGLLERSGLGLHGMRARLRAARIARGHGESKLALEITKEAWDHMLVTDIGAPPLFEGLAADLELTAREWQLARLVGDGASNARIADELVLSVRTVENHLSSIFRKLGAESREELADAVRTWLVQPGASRIRL